LGWLVASYASGALIGSLCISAWGRHWRPAQTMLLACVVWHMCLAGYAFPMSLPAAKLMLLCAGLAQSVSMVSLSILLLRTCDERFRGRVMGVRMLAIYTLPLGLLAAGSLIPAIGFRTTAAAYVSLGLVLTVAIAWTWRKDLLARHAVANAR
jgi:SNF family Na+-dependent transporter